MKFKDDINEGFEEEMSKEEKEDHFLKELAFKKALQYTGEKRKSILEEIEKTDISLYRKLMSNFDLVIGEIYGVHITMDSVEIYKNIYKKHIGKELNTKEAIVFRKTSKTFREDVELCIFNKKDNFSYFETIKTTKQEIEESNKEELKIDYDKVELARNKDNLNEHEQFSIELSETKTIEELQKEIEEMKKSQLDCAEKLKVAEFNKVSELELEILCLDRDICCYEEAIKILTGKDINKISENKNQSNIKVKKR
jgi:hypothetical protein